MRLKSFCIFALLLFVPLYSQDWPTLQNTLINFIDIKGQDSYRQPEILPEIHITLFMPRQGPMANIHIRVMAAQLL